MIEEQDPQPDDQESSDGYRPPVETMKYGQIDRELREVFGVSVMYLLVPIFLLVTGSISVVASRWFLRVLPGAAAVFVAYWILLRAFAPMYDASPEMANRYSLLISRIAGGIMSTSHSRLAALYDRREELKDLEHAN